MKVLVKKDGHHFYTHINQVVVDAAKTPPQLQDIINNDKKEDFKGKDADHIKDRCLQMAICFVILDFCSASS